MRAGRAGTAEQHPRQDPVVESPSWLDTASPAVRPDIEIVQGANDETVAFDPRTGHYTRLSRSGAAILRALDGRLTGREFAAAVVRRSPRAGAAERRSAEQVVLAFLDELRAAGLLTVPPAPGRGRDAVRFARRSHLPRRPLVTEQVNRFIDPVAVVLRRAPKLVAAVWTAAALAALLQVWAVISSPDPSRGVSSISMTWGWALLVGAFLTQITAHELSHAVACRYYGVRVREIGVGLLFYVVPAAYVDRTDAYRLSGRSARVVISLAGVALDVLWIGGYAALSAYGSGQVAQVAGILMWVQLAFLFGNLNPLLPTDGYHALEAAFATLNLRSRAFAALRCAVLREPRPSWLAARSTARRIGYQVFGIVCLAYAALIVLLVVRGFALLIG